MDAQQTFVIERPAGSVGDAVQPTQRRQRGCHRSIHFAVVTCKGESGTGSPAAASGSDNIRAIVSIVRSVAPRFWLQTKRARLLISRCRSSSERSSNKIAASFVDASAV